MRQTSSLYGTMLLVSMEPTSRQLRILGNLMDRNLIWEAVGHQYFVQYDNRSERELRIKPEELEEMAERGWIRRVCVPRSEQRLDRYELTNEAWIFEEISRRKAPHRESELVGRIRAHKRA